MPFNISEFRIQFDIHKGFQRPNLFQVTIALPKLLQSIYNSTVRDIQFYCIEGIIPSPVIDAIPNFRYGYGPFEKMPFMPVFNDVTYLFIGDGDAFIKNFFRTWQRAIVEYVIDDNIATGSLTQPNRTTLNMTPYMLNYKDDYSTIINISTWDSTGQTRTDDVDLHQTFPINVSDLTYNWEACDRFEIIPVTFSYRDISYGSVFPVTSNTGTTSTSNGFFSGLISGIENKVSATASQLRNLI